jgi:glycerol-3-phosphate dehydrogenase
MIPKTSDGRVLFAIPWHGRLLVGTTDTPVPTAEIEPHAMKAEIDFILETAGAHLERKPTHSDILSVFAGVRPLVKPSRAFKNTAKLSRGHTIETDRRGMITVTGGKWTTYRRMAEDAVDAAVRVGSLSAAPCRTRELPIVNSALSSELRSAPLIHTSLPYTFCDVARAVRSEMAVTLEEVMARRTRCLFLDAQAAMEAAEPVARAMAGMLGEGDEWVDEQVRVFAEVAENYVVKGQNRER